MSDDGDWVEMKRLVLDRLDQQRQQLNNVSDSVVKINTQLAIMSDREDREMAVAKSASMKVAGIMGTIVSAVVAGLLSVFGGE
jgi:predicted nucleic acid-binding protein